MALCRDNVRHREPSRAIVLICSAICARPAQRKFIQYAFVVVYLSTKMNAASKFQSHAVCVECDKRQRPLERDVTTVTFRPFRGRPSNNNKHSSLFFRLFAALAGLFSLFGSRGAFAHTPNNNKKINDTYIRAYLCARELVCCCYYSMILNFHCCHCARALGILYDQ